MTSFSFFKYFDTFELDVNDVNFVYYGKTRMKYSHHPMDIPFRIVFFFSQLFLNSCEMLFLLSNNTNFPGKKS